ncbi:MAG: hypothetical protein LBI15_05400 [Dysgonamonadaceae bacterium]|jgi:hypothetical protein|nr:hypothetical protein [Dysgonamonadaceae bacterium]
MSTVIAHIDVSRPLGRKIVRDLYKHTKTVKIENPLSEEIESQEWVSHEDFWLEMEDKLNEHYGTNQKLKIRK